MTIIAYYLVIQIILNLFFKQDRSILLCGISGFSALKGLTEEQEKIVMNKMKILGLYNQSRGSHGCGMYINGQIFKGYNNLATKQDTKLFSKFIGNPNWVVPHFDSASVPNILIHSRQATYGAQVEANNHPFLIESENPKNSIIGVHNGTIENIWDLCNKNGVKHADYHVDSKALFALISKLGFEEVLKSYKGYASLIWTKPTEPHSLYIFHGASRRMRDQAVFEERPLYFMKTQEGIYFSSMDESLLAIRENEDQKPYDVEYNKVLKVTNGKFTSSKIVIDRENANLYSYVEKETYAVPFRNQSQIGFPTKNTKQEDKDLKAPKTSLVWTETTPPREAEEGKTRIFFHKGRYWFPGPLLVHGEQYLNCKGFLDDKTQHETKPYYFYAGVLLPNEGAFKNLEELKNDGKSWINKNETNFAYCISKFSAQPVTNLESEFIDKKDEKAPWWKFSWYKDGHRVGENFSARFSSRTYIIKDGFLTGITSSDPGDKRFFEGEEPDNTTFRGQGCKIGGKSVISRRGAGEEVCFDSIFETMQEALGAISGIERLAMIEFCTEQLKVLSLLDPTEEEVDAYYLQALRTAVSDDKTLREVLGDDTSTLEMYMQMIEEEQLKEALGVGSTEDEIKEWEEAFYHKNGYFPGKQDKATVDAETDFHQDNHM